jgi:two-component system catabolic regulation response regulator CreB/two-component system response regulator ChvI
LARILVVDDEPDIATVIKRALEKEGFFVDAFTNPGEALASFKPDYYVMMITDIKMPVMSGFDLYREIMKKDAKVRVAFTTAFELYEDEFRRVFKDIDVNCFIKKPVSMSDLLGRVKSELVKHEVNFE